MSNILSLVKEIMKYKSKRQKKENYKTDIKLV